jgi:hypothetical protein
VPTWNLIQIKFPFVLDRLLPVQSKTIDTDVVMADDILSRLQKTLKIKFSAFEYFEPIQDVPLDLPFAASETTLNYLK